MEYRPPPPFIHPHDQLSYMEPISAAMVKDKYLLSRDDSERQRLNEQHKYFIKFVYDGNLVYQPQVAERLERGGKLRVLDNATGTAAWLEDLARELPTSVELHGVDLSASNFPSEASRPKNMFLHTESITNLPAHWSNHFDFVNQRLLIMSLSKADWPKAVSEIFRILKPGASVQIAEREPAHRGARPGSAMARHDAIFKRMYETLGYNHNCAMELAGMLDRAGFVNISDDIKMNPLGKFFGDDGESGARCYEGAYKNVGPMLVEKGLVGCLEEYEDLLRDLRKEWDEQGGEVACHMICATKP